MIVGLENLADIRSQHQNEKIVLTSGTFDLLHVGHLSYIDAARALGDIVVVMVSGDDRVKARKGPKRPIVPENERVHMLNQLRTVDYVFVDPARSAPSEIDPIHAKIVNKLQPDIYATDGADPRFWNIMEESKLVILPRSDVDTSTTAIIERMERL